MAVLLDSNILLRLLQPHHPHSPFAERALNILGTRNEVLNLTAQKSGGVLGCDYAPRGLRQLMCFRLAARSHSGRFRTRGRAANEALPPEFGRFGTVGVCDVCK
jgi:hypothetical protein